MSVDTDPQFARIVSEKMDQAIDTGKAQRIRRGATRNDIQTVLLNPDTGMTHFLRRQPFSHIVETPRATTRLDSSVQVSAEPQRVLVQPNGLISLLMKREAIPIRPEGIADTKKSVSDAIPISETELQRMQDVDIRYLFELSPSQSSISLQERAQRLLRSGMFSRRFIAIEKSLAIINDTLQERKVARATFASDEHSTSGAVINGIDGRTLDDASVEMTINFSRPQVVSLVDENVRTTMLDISIVGNDVVSLDRHARLEGESPELISRIINSAILIPLRDV